MNQPKINYAARRAAGWLQWGTERENVDIRLREMRAASAEERKTKLDQMASFFESFGAGARNLLDDRTRMTSLVAGFTALALGVYSARAAARVAGNYIEKNL